MYSGSKEGILQKEILVRGKIAGTSLKTAIAHLGYYIRKELLTLLGYIENMITREEFEKYKDDNKCFTIAGATP